MNVRVKHSLIGCRAAVHHDMKTFGPVLFRNQILRFPNKFKTPNVVWQGQVKNSGNVNASDN